MRKNLEHPMISCTSILFSRHICNRKGIPRKILEKVNDKGFSKQIYRSKITNLHDDNYANLRQLLMFQLNKSPYLKYF